MTVPPRGAGSATTVPPWLAATSRTTARPRPEPGAERVESAR